MKTLGIDEIWTPLAKQAALGILVGGGAGLAIVVGGESGMAAVYGACLIAGLGILASRYPTFTVAAWAILTVHLREVVAVRDVHLAAGVDVLPSDPILLAIGAAIGFKLLVGDRRTKEVLTGPCLFWTLLMMWVVFEISRSASTSGIVSSVGEFKRTFQAFLVVPYICIFFRTPRQQRVLLYTLLTLSFIMIAIGLWNGGIKEQFAISSKTRWLVAQSNLALLWGAIALLIVRRQDLLKGRIATYSVLMLLAIVLTIVCNHRSVWMAGAAGFVALLLTDQLSISTAVKVGLVTLCALIGLDFAYAGVDLFEFIQSRLTAFTSVQNDPTANWRLEVWTEALRQSREHWFLGKGLGSYFSLELTGGRTATTSLHNLYIQLYYQLGVVGLLLYLGQLSTTYWFLWRARRAGQGPIEAVIVTTAIIVLSGASVFYLAYAFDTSTWLYVGLGLAVAHNHRAAMRAEPSRKRYTS